MEKLLLRGVMWGVDKVPDAWFDKIPGNYFRPEDGNEKSGQDQGGGDDDNMKQRSSRRRSEDGFDDDRQSRDDREDGYRSDGHGWRSDRRKHAKDYDSINDRPRRQRSRTDQYRSEKRRPREPRQGDSRMDSLFSYHDGPVDLPANADPNPAGSPAAYGSARGFGGVGMDGSPYAPSSAAGTAQPYPPQPTYESQSTSTSRGGVSTGYVPYSNIYGGPAQQQPYAPPPSDIGSVQPNYMNQVAPPVVAKQQDYCQNPFAQEAHPGSQPAYIPDPRRFEQRPNVEDNDSTTGTARGLSRSPTRDHHRSRRDDYSPSEDSYDSRRTRPADGRRRARSERREERDREKPRGKSGIRNAFDTSQKGLGYSAVGALAGGLVGKELGKGAVTTTVGAALGALASNAFQARERMKEDRRSSTWSREPDGASGRRGGDRDGYDSD